MVKFWSKSTKINDLLTADQTPMNFALTHPKHVPLITSPLADDYIELSHSPSRQAAVKGLHSSFQATDGDVTPHSSEPAERYQDPDEPNLRRAHESSTIQLFYDLFFVANLTTFTSVHEVTSLETLSSYIAFFSILWFTWLQVALFDVRFSNDSAFERFCKALQFGVMTGLAVIGPNYDTSGGDFDTFRSSFEALSLILMFSRLVLALQYTTIWWWTKDYKKVRLPLLAHVGILFATAMIFLGLSFSFGGAIGLRGRIGWYVVIGVEALAILLVSGRSKCLSFRKTGIVERLGLLTLIILGEGVIGMSGSIAKVSSAHGFTADVIGMIISGVLIIYFLWMLYFDQIETERVGTMSQQFWALLHFPFHVCVLLVVEGVAQLAVWRKVIDVLTPFGNAMDIYIQMYSDNPHSLNISAINNTIYDVFNNFVNSTEGASPYYEEAFARLEGTLGNTTNRTEAGIAFLDIVTSVEDVVLNTYNIHIKESVETEDVAKNLVNAQEDIFATFTTVFLYFFVAAGVTLILLALLFYLGKRRKTRGEYLSMAVRIFFGLGLTLIATMYNSDPEVASNDFNNYLSSAWMLPTVLIAYGIVILLDTVLVNYVRKAVYRRATNQAAIPLYGRPETSGT